MINLVDIGGDKRMELYNAHIARKISIGTDWQRIRIGARFTFDDLGASPGIVKLMLGMLSDPSAGLANGPIDLLTSHFVGVTTQQSAWVRYSGPPAYYDDMSVQAIKRVDNTDTVSSGAGAIMPADTRRVAWIVDITKDSPNFSVRTVHPANLVDISDINWVVAAMEAGDTAANMVSVLEAIASGSDYTLADHEVAVDESTDGYLNAVCVGWNRASFACRVSEVLWSKVA